MFDFDGEDKCVNSAPIWESLFVLCAAIFYKILQYYDAFRSCKFPFHKYRIHFLYKYKEEKEEKVKLKSAKVDRT